MEKKVPDMRDADGLVPRCPEHPYYKGIREPRVDCEQCRILHAKYHQRPYRRAIKFEVGI